MDDLKNFFCRNKQCAKYGIRGEENIRVRARYGTKTPGCSTAPIAKKPSPNAKAPSFFARLCPMKPSFPFTNTSPKAMACERPAA
jgi:hypothetical protein